MFKDNIKFIDVRFISNKTILVQLLKLFKVIKYSLENSTNKEIVLTIKFKNKYNSKLLISVNDNNLDSLPCNNDIVIGE